MLIVYILIYYKLYFLRHIMAFIATFSIIFRKNIQKQQTTLFQLLTLFI